MMVKTNATARQNDMPAALLCPSCGGKLDVKDSRPTTYRGMSSVRRRRHCRKCGHRVTTFELIGTENDFAEAKIPKIIAAARTASQALGALIEQYDAPDATDAEQRHVVV